ncbi:MAG: hypothetical protein JSS02_27170 [Planctomycetes bacterium]|nr:hypothetical protein [Planctomycetota bacterium]
MQSASLGSQARLSMAAPGTAWAAFTESHEFVSERLGKQLTILETAGIRGTRSHPAERTRDGTYAVRGAIQYHCSPSLLNWLLPRILGAGTAPTYTLAEALPEFDVLIDRVAQRFLYGSCRVDRAVFRARASGLVELLVELLGTTETVSQLPFPTLAPPTDWPYVWQDCTVTLNGAPRVVTEFELIIDNHLAPRWANSPTATDLYPTDRTVHLQAVVPFTGDTADLYGANTAGASAASLAFTNGAHSLTLQLAQVQFADVSPQVPGKSEIFLHLAGFAKSVGGTPELTITNT